MEYRSLTLVDRAPWGQLLAASFDRTPAQMEQLLDWFHAGFPLVTWGAWDGDRLVAQYNARMLRLNMPGLSEPVLAGMGLNMCVDAAYRGRGLLETVATPVHEMLAQRGCIAGVGFSSEGGLAVTRRSASYGYQVLGPMTSSVVLLSHRRYPGGVELVDSWPAAPLAIPRGDPTFVSYAVGEDALRHRFAEHPFRRYAYGVCRDSDRVHGLVVYRLVRLRGVRAAALLGAYGDDLAGLLAGWAGAMRRARIHAVHVLTSPAAPIRRMLPVMGLRITVPVTRHPYHLITRGLGGDVPPVLFDLERWDCTGGDIL